VADHSHEHVHIAASPTACFGVATDFEAYPEWANDVKDARIVDRLDDGTPSRVEYHVAAMGRSLRYVLEYDLTEGPHAFTWWLVEGDLLRTLEGRYGFADADGGTDVSYELKVDLVVPMPGLVKRRAAGRIVNAALADLKRTVEARASGGADDVSDAEHEPADRPPDAPLVDPAPAPTTPNEDEGVQFHEVGREPRSLPAPGAIEHVVSELLGAVPEVRDHLLAAADELLDAARAVIEAADRVVRQQRDGRPGEGGS
jgi:hypothetical protein